MRKIYWRLRGKRWWHNRVYPADFTVRNTGEHGLQVCYRQQQLTVRTVAALSDVFAARAMHVVLSGPSVKEVASPKRLNAEFCFTVNGSPALFEANGLPYDAYVADDPGFVKQRGADVVRYAARAQYCFFSYRTLCLLLMQGHDLSGLNIYVFDYRFMPYRRRREFEPQLYFARTLTEGLALCDSVVYIVLQLAFGMGFKHVALFGMDLSMNGRFYAEHNAQPQFLDQHWQTGIVEPLTLVGDMARQGLWRVINCSVNSRLPADVLPKCDANDYLASNANV
ncbi:MAG: hypothetical protein ACRCV6_08990 [Formosimonas sp.]